MCQILLNIITQSRHHRKQVDSWDLASGNKAERLSVCDRTRKKSLGKSTSEAEVEHPCREYLSSLRQDLVRPSVPQSPWYERVAPRHGSSGVSGRLGTGSNRSPAAPRSTSSWHSPARPTRRRDRRPRPERLLCQLDPGLPVLLRGTPLRTGDAGERDLAGRHHRRGEPNLWCSTAGVVRGRKRS